MIVMQASQVCDLSGAIVGGGIRQMSQLIPRQHLVARGDKRLLTKMREQRVVGAVGIEMRCAVRVVSSRRKAAVIDVRRDADACRITHRIESPALLVVEGLQLTERVQGSRRGARAGQ